LDEVIECGYPQSLDFNTLKQIIPPVSNGNSSNVSKITSKKVSRIDMNSEIPWRKPGIKYRKNEIYLDVYEKVNVLISQDGKIIKSYIDGHIDMKTHLSGMPVCKFGFNDSLSLNTGDSDWLSEYDVKNKKAIPKAAAGCVILEDCKFHQCVELDKYDSDRVIQFIPPDGEFELMRYRASENLNLPFKVTPLISETGLNNLELRLSVKSLFPAKLTATDVVVKVPMTDIIDADFASSGGKAKLSTQDGCILWKFNKFSGLTEHSLTAQITLAHTNQNSLVSSKAPITLIFELLMFSSSGLVVRFLKVLEKSHHYSTIKWVRYISQGGSYEVRY
jgi:AP-2 complex subunit mu-1